MKKQKKSSFSIKPIICLALLALCIIITSAVKGHAAGKKTVRVTTQDELVDAINNANVGTIILRSETRDAITIASNENAKGKKIVIDVPYATVNIRWSDPGLRIRISDFTVYERINRVDIIAVESHQMKSVFYLETKDSGSATHVHTERFK